MKEIILPGYSPKNLEWAENVRDKLTGHDVTIINWEHWSTNSLNGISLVVELAKVSQEAGGEKFNVVAKSIGTWVLMHILRQMPSQVEKIALFGIPLRDLSADDKKAYSALYRMDQGRVLCIQNKNDPHGTWEEVKSFFERVNPRIEVLAAPRSDHEYPYFEEIADFLHTG